VGRKFFQPFSFFLDIDLGGRNRKRLDQKVGAVGTELSSNRLKFFYRIAGRGVRRIDEMEKKPAAFDVTEKLKSQSFTGMRAFDQAGNVRHDEIRMAFGLDHTQM